MPRFLRPAGERGGTLPNGLPASFARRRDTAESPTPSTQERDGLILRLVGPTHGAEGARCVGVTEGPLETAREGLRPLCRPQTPPSAL